MPGKRLLGRLREHIKEYEDNGTKESAETLVWGVKQFIDSHYKRPVHVYSVCKKMIYERNPSVPLRKAADSMLRENAKEKQATLDMAQKALEKRNDVVTKFEYAYVQAVVQMGAESDLPGLNFIALQIASGCRQRDLFDPRMCQFTIPSLEWAATNSVLQTGGSKTRGKEFNMRKTLVMMSPSNFIRLLGKFRSAVNYCSESAAEITNRWNPGLCALTRDYFPVDQERSGTHINRALYAAVLRFNSEASGPRAVQRALGHTNMLSSLHYLYVEVCRDGTGFTKDVA